MENFQYFELIAFFYRGIFDQIRQGQSFEQAVNSTLDDFWLYPEHENRLANLIVQIQYLFVIYSMTKSFTPKQIEVYKTQLDLVKNDDLNTWLNQEELAHLNESIIDMNEYIKGIS